MRHFFGFLDASSHLYKRVCPLVRPSVGRSVGPSVGRSVRNPFFSVLIRATLGNSGQLWATLDYTRLHWTTLDASIGQLLALLITSWPVFLQMNHQVVHPILVHHCLKKILDKQSLSLSKPPWLP